MRTLEKQISSAITKEILPIQVNPLIQNNLNPKFKIRPYQEEAFSRFAYYLNQYKNKPEPSQLLFHMATGSGKTLIMAGVIIHLYEQGYRNFLFFVDNTNIIEKTRGNFFNVNSSKYLFADRITIGDKQISIKEVNNFQAVNKEDINIVFSTIQGLHSRINNPKENNITYEDFEETKVVLLSDEAHHINAETKKNLAKSEIENLLTWEGTVNQIFNANKENMLLEFTATADLGNPEIREKYEDKLIFNYPLKQFRLDGYSKEVKVLQADLSQFERALQGVLLSQYRRKVFEKYQKNVKPVILFKSKKIEDSRNFLDEFKRGIENLSVSDLEKIKNSNPNKAIKKVFQYLEDNHINLENFVSELKEDFSEEKLISVDSKDESEEKQLAVNSLEDEKNQYRAVFAVDKLNEGWDVLNLFDIVRLYNTRDGRKGIPGKTTISEAQLIGRGARYFPFQISEDQPFFSRKYDDDINHELRICEELYYHSSYNPEYIRELNTALVSIGMKEGHSIQKEMKLKPSFKESTFYKSGMIFLNEQEKSKLRHSIGFKPSIVSEPYKVDLKTGYSNSTDAFEVNISSVIERKKKEFKILDFGENIIRKSINKLDFYQFSNLKTYLPNLKSISEFITSEEYLGNAKVNISGLTDHLKNLTPRDKLESTLKVLEDISTILVSNDMDYTGSKQFKPVRIKDKITDKVLNFNLSANGDKDFGKPMNDSNESNFHLDLSKKKWYVFEDYFGTSEEKLLIKYFDQIYDKLKSKYDEIYLIPNKKNFKIYNFEDGKAFEPDFVLFMLKNETEESINHQIFIELKSKHLLKKHEWKESFLKEFQEDHNQEKLGQNEKFFIWGLSVYTDEQRQNQFKEGLYRIINSKNNQ